VQTVPVPDSSDHVDVETNVVEKPSPAVNVGVGYSTSDRAMASAGMTQNKVFGNSTSTRNSRCSSKRF
jgi:outer membrane protein insertion porin family